MLRMYEGATVLSTLITVYSISCHGKGHINVMLVLQSCTDSVDILPGLSHEPYETSYDGACNIGSIGEEDVDIIEEGFVYINKEVNIGIKREEFPEDISFHGIKSEPDLEVS